MRLRVAVTQHILLEAQGQVTFPFNRPVFTVADNGISAVAYSVPRVGAVAGIGAAYRF